MDHNTATINSLAMKVQATEIPDIPVGVTKSKDSPRKSIGWRWKVEVDEDEDDKGPVELTGAYKSVVIDIKRLKERLCYLSKKWEMRIISIYEKDREATEHRQDSSVEKTLARDTVSCTAVNHEAIVVHQEPQSVLISHVKPQLLMQTYNDSTSTEDTEMGTSLVLKADEKLNRLNDSRLHDHAIKKPLTGSASYLNQSIGHCWSRQVSSMGRMQQVQALARRLVQVKVTGAIKSATMKYKAAPYGGCYSGCRIVFDPGSVPTGSRLYRDGSAYCLA